MKSLTFIKNSLAIYFSKNKDFLNLANRTRLKTAFFTIFLINIVINSVFYFNISADNIVSKIIMLIISIIISFIVVIGLTYIIGGITHLTYKPFKQNAKFRKLLIAITALVCGFVFYGGIFLLLRKALSIYYDMPFNLSFVYLINGLAILFTIWSLFVFIKFLSRIEKVNFWRSLISFIVSALIISGIFYLLNIARTSLIF